MQSGEPITIKGREYRLGAVLSTGAGSYGQVWAATDAAGRAVALKFINAEAMSQADGSLHGHWRAHLEREIAFLDGLGDEQSRHVVTLLAHDQVDGQPVLVLERMQANLGQWLSQLRREGAPPPDLACILDWAEQILDGLDVIHRAGFVYRDLKFSNILVGEGGALLKLADFGSLKREDGDSTRSCIGTPATMAPEQIVPIRQGANGCEYAVDFRADYYALGLLLFALLTEQSTTAAQRRLGQLLALHGQEGAGQHRDELGGLTEEERELLRRSIEFWTVPARPEQEQRGTALLLTDLLGQLLAREPAARPASSATIRAVLDAVRADQPTLPPMLSDRLAPPPDIPPNRHPRRANASARSPRSRWAIGLIGISGLVGALAWAAVIRPALHQERFKSPSAVLAPVSQPDSGAKSIPAPDSIMSANSALDASAKPSQPEQPSPSEPARVEDTVAGTTATSPEETPPASSDEPSVAASAGSATEAAAETVPATDTETKAGTPADPAAEMRPSAPPTTAAVAETAPEAPPGNPNPSVAPSAAGAASRSTEPSTSTAAPASRKAITSPAVAERSPAMTTRKPAGEKTVKAAPIPDGTLDKSVRTPPPAATKPADTPRPVVPVSPKAPAIAKPVPRSPAPNPPAITRHALPSEKAATEQRVSKAAVPVVRERPAPKLTASRPAPGTTRSTAHSPVLPPIELVSNPDTAKAAPSSARPPIELVSRAMATTDTSTRARPPIELVGRSNPSPVTPPLRPATPPATNVAGVAARNPTTTPKAPTGPADPITALQKDAGKAAHDIRREAENIGNWMGRTSASVGTEIRRGLDSANRAVGSWTGSCAGTNGCPQARQVERRDRWTRSSQGTVSRSQPPVPGERDGPGNSPPQRVQEYR